MKKGDFMNRPLYQRIQYDIIRRIQSGELAEGDLVPSEKDLSLQYGVSRITAKNALNGLVERGLLSRYRGKGTFVRTSPEAKRRRTFPTGDNKTIAVILPAMKTKNDQRLLDGLEKYCTKAHYNILVRITRESQDEEARAIEQFRETGADGFIIIPVERENYNDEILRLSLDRIPLVLVSCFLKEIKTYSVSSDNVGGVREAVSDLIARGHRRIAYLSPEITNTATDERARGYELACMDHGMPIDKTLWCMLPFETIVQGGGQDEITRFLNEKNVTAVLAVNAELAQYAFQAIRTLCSGKTSYPELVAFDDADLEGIPHIRQQEDEISRLAVALLSEQLHGRFDPRRITVPIHYKRALEEV
ncbi:Arabinose metabolism transcriptional repressor [Paenibacillus sp. CECT 9249]|nr:Arabinose metabolism transcriptional repressor [Paenibacillus sp. CECT 9249]